MTQTNINTLSSSSFTIMERFIDSVDLSDNGCWQWNKSLASNGYGKFFIGDDNQFLAHRFSYTVFVGEIPANLQIDHLCRNKGCVNPEHLEAVTQEENIRRADRPSYYTDICNKGHKLIEVGFYADSRGIKTCRQCKAERNRLYAKTHPDVLARNQRRYYHRHKAKSVSV